MTQFCAKVLSSFLFWFHHFGIFFNIHIESHKNKADSVYVMRARTESFLSSSLIIRQLIDLSFYTGVMDPT